jgi:hypothetical protein
MEDISSLRICTLEGSGTLLDFEDCTDLTVLANRHTLAVYLLLTDGCPAQH